MSLNELDVIDAVGTDVRDGAVVLTVIDAWDWKDEAAHLYALQEKLNAYFEFVESGQIHETYPGAQDRSVRIEIVSRLDYPPSATAFVEQASEVASQLNMTVTQRRAGPAEECRH